ncbi:MAG: DUF6285 domain-containing protein [Candidatus Promineifilaceae bacterium]|nr:DUF6285 domain-containing protein [Candidatus Promineifilaceae bacterium]
MQDRPTAPELVAAVRRHLSEEVIPALGDPGLRFRTLVAANVLAVVGREMEMASEQAPREWQRLARLLGRSGSPPSAYRRQLQEIAEMNEALCRQIEAGAFDGAQEWVALLDHCRQTAREKLTIANPKFLARVEES